MPRVVEKDKLLDGGLVGPIAEGETPEQAVARIERTFGSRVRKYAFVMHPQPIEEPFQQFKRIIGAVWCDRFSKDQIVEMSETMEDEDARP